MNRRDEISEIEQMIHDLWNASADPGLFGVAMVKAIQDRMADSVEVTWKSPPIEEYDDSEANVDA